MTIDQTPTGRLRLATKYYAGGWGTVLEMEIRHSRPLPHSAHTWWIQATAKDLENELCKSWVDEHCPKLGSLLDTTA